MQFIRSVKHDQKALCHLLETDENRCIFHFCCRACELDLYSVHSNVCVCVVWWCLTVRALDSQRVRLPTVPQSAFSNNLRQVVHTHTPPAAALAASLSARCVQDRGARTSVARWSGSRGPIPMTCGSCSCREHTTNSLMGVSWPPVLDCGTTFHWRSQDF